MNDFEKIGQKHGCDKILHHGYHRFYPFFLDPLRKKKIKMLEIGIEHKHSLNLWLEYFPKAFIYGIDKDIAEKGSRYQIFKCRQENRSAIEALNLVHLDFIIDDGSHVPGHQLESFNYLFFSCLSPSGIYIIEDTETSYWKNGSLYNYNVTAGYKKQNSIIEIFKDVADEINKEFLSAGDWIQHNETHPIYQDVRSLIGTITFCQNAIIIQKKDLSYEPFDNRQYRWKDLSGIEEKKKICIYQSYYSAETKKHIDPGFIPFDNTGKETNIYENQILLNIYSRRKKQWKESDYVGLVSWRFFEKTGLSSRQVLSRIEQHQDPRQVYLLTPKSYIGKFPPIFSKVGFKQTQDLCRIVDQAYLFPFQLLHRDTEPIISFCNFWLCTPEIFSDYIENYLKPLIDFLQHPKTKALRKVLSSTVQHNNQPYPPHAFFLEGFFQCYLHYKQFTYEYILQPDPPGAMIRPAAPMSRRRIDFGETNRLDSLISTQA